MISSRCAPKGHRFRATSCTGYDLHCKEPNIKQTLTLLLHKEALGRTLDPNVFAKRYSKLPIVLSQGEATTQNCCVGARTTRKCVAGNGKLFTDHVWMMRLPPDPCPILLSSSNNPPGIFRATRLLTLLLCLGMELSFLQTILCCGSGVHCKSNGIVKCFVSTSYIPARIRSV